MLSDYAVAMLLAMVLIALITLCGIIAALVRARIVEPGLAKFMYATQAAIMVGFCIGTVWNGRV